MGQLVEETRCDIDGNEEHGVLGTGGKIKETPSTGDSCQEQGLQGAGQMEEEVEGKDLEKQEEVGYGFD